MSAVLQRDKNSTEVVKDAPSDRKRALVNDPRTTEKLESLSDENRKVVFTLTGKEVASSLGSRILLEMLAASGLSMRELARKSGFDVSQISKVAQGKRLSGPELWTLIAFADAMDLDLKLSFSKR